jgi:hypothetical protein
MVDPSLRLQLSDDLLRRFGAAVRGIQLYSRDHPIVSRNIDAFGEALRGLHLHEPSIVIGVLDGELIVGDVPMSKASASMGELIRRLTALGIERITIAHDVTPDEVKQFVVTFAKLDKPSSEDDYKNIAAQLESEAIKIGQVTLSERAPEEPSDAGTIRRMYMEAVSVAQPGVGKREGGWTARSDAGAADGRRPGAGCDAEPVRASRTHGLEGVRQLHVSRTW